MGLGAGMGFIYWQQKGVPPFIGGRANVKNFFQDIGSRTGVVISEHTTSSAAKAERALLDLLAKQQPVFVFADMGLLPWFDLPEEYHFGGHTFVACGFDGESMVLASDIDQKATGVKKGYYHEISLEQLSKARNSSYKPFPPKNAYLELDFSAFRAPAEEDLRAAILQAADQMLDPPISNFGIKGIRRTAKEIAKWPKQFDDRELRLNLFNIYIFVEIGGTGGGCFRSLYSRFLKEAAQILDAPVLPEAANLLQRSGEMFTEFALPLKEAATQENLQPLIETAPDRLNAIAEVEEGAFGRLVEAL